MNSDDERRVLVRKDLESAMAKAVELNFPAYQTLEYCESNSDSVEDRTKEICLWILCCEKKY